MWLDPHLEISHNFARQWWSIGGDDASQEPCDGPIQGGRDSQPALCGCECWVEGIVAGKEVKEDNVGGNSMPDGRS